MSKQVSVSWLLASALVVSVGCGSDSKPNTADGGSEDGGTLDAGHHGGKLDAGGGETPDAGDSDETPDAGSMDASIENEDAGAGDAGQSDAGLDAGDVAADLEIAGSWYGPKWGESDVIASQTWEQYGETMAVIEYDNADNYAIVQRPHDDMYNPDKFSKMVWLDISGGSFYYCEIGIGSATAAAALATAEKADATDLVSGCGSFDSEWTKLVPAIEIEGTWDLTAGTLDIASDTWGDQTVVSYDNATNSAITKNSAAAATNASKFNKVEWTDVKSGVAYYCVTAANEATAADATSHASDADPTKLETGCNAGAWTKLDAP